MPDNQPNVTGGTLRIPALDGFRGMAVLIVMLFHGQVIHTAPDVHPLLWKFIAMGWCGVTMFFVLSGFLITGILYDTKKQAGYFRNFYARRVLRIFPLYYAVIIAFFAARWFAHKPTDIGGTCTYFVYLANFNMARIGEFRFPPIDVSWSLSIEEQFYLVWPLVVFFMPRRALLWVCGATILIAIAFRVWLIRIGVNPMAIYVLTPSHLDALAVGASLALLVRHPTGPAGLIVPARITAVACGATLLGELFFGPPMLWISRFTQTIGLTCFAGLFGSALILAVLRPSGMFRHLFDRAPLRVLGKYSYALYLFHVTIGTLLLMLRLNPDRLPSIGGSSLLPHLLFDVALIAVTFVAAGISWHGYEKHLLRLKRYFEYRRLR